MDSGNTNSSTGHTITTDPISSLLNPTPTFFNFPLPNPLYDPTLNAFQNDHVYLNSHPPETSTSTANTTHPVGASTKNPKKRTRASRRAPTTVLTTDTTNFRQMVQEFTGIPTAPFTRRLDLLSAGGLFPVRPVVQQQSFDINGFQNQTLLDSQNPMFSFQKQTLLGTAETDNQQLDASCSSTVNDQSDKGLEM